MTTDLKIPGPGTYESTAGEVQKGDQVVSHYHTILTPNLGSTGEQRPSDKLRFKTPGPGTYRPPSDFGYVDLIPKIDNRSVMDNYQQSILGSTTRSGLRSSRQTSLMSRTANSFNKNNKAFDSLLGESKRGQSIFAVVSTCRTNKL